MRWLEGDTDATEFMAQTDSTAYGGFNLVVGDYQTDSWTWLSNRSFESSLGGPVAQRAQGNRWCSRALPPGVYGLSNAALDTPWPKTLALKAALTSALDAAHEAPDPVIPDTPLWTALANRSRTSPESWPDTGLPGALEESLSSAFVDAPERAYGTRCSTLLVASAAENVQHKHCLNVRVEEKTHAQPQGNSSGISLSNIVLKQVFQWQKNRASP